MAGFVAWEGMQGRYSAASHVSTLCVIAVVLVLAAWAGHGRQRTPSRVWLRGLWRDSRGMVGHGQALSARSVGAAVWTLLIAATAAWDGASFAVQRHWLPTLSRMFGAITDLQAGRALVFAGWLVLGLYLALGWRRPVQEVQFAEPGFAEPREEDAR